MLQSISGGLLILDFFIHSHLLASMATFSVGSTPVLDIHEHPTMLR